MEEARALPERQDYTIFYVGRKEFPKFSGSIKFGSSGELKISGKVSREEKNEKTVSKSISVAFIDGESLNIEEKEDEDDKNISMARTEPSISIPSSSSDEFKDFHYGDRVNLNANYEVILISDSSISLKLKNITPKITRRVKNV